ncbi:hypothetical protein KK120_18560 [Virgibacillus dakarensis]|nr:hypothetical protein [Virgibacillus dakarensis]
MEDILFIIVGLLIGGGLIYLFYFLFNLYNSTRAKLLKKGVTLPDLNLLEEKIHEKVVEIEENFDGDYKSDPKGERRFNMADNFLEWVIKTMGLEDKIDAEDRKKIIKNTVKGAGFVLGKNPYKK